MWEQTTAKPIELPVSDKIKEWIVDRDTSFDLFKEAVSRMVIAEIKPRNMNYVASILREWKENDVKTIADARDEADKFEERKLKKEQDKKVQRFDSKKVAEKPKENKYEKFYL